MAWAELSPTGPLQAPCRGFGSSTTHKTKCRRMCFGFSLFVDKLNPVP